MQLVILIIVIVIVIVIVKMIMIFFLIQKKKKYHILLFIKLPQELKLTIKLQLLPHIQKKNSQRQPNTQPQSQRQQNTQPQSQRQPNPQPQPQRQPNPQPQPQPQRQPNPQPQPQRQRQPNPQPQPQRQRQPFTSQFYSEPQQQRQRQPFTSQFYSEPQQQSRFFKSPFFPQQHNSQYRPEHHQWSRASHSQYRPEQQQWSRASQSQYRHEPSPFPGPQPQPQPRPQPQPQRSRPPPYQPSSKSPLTNKIPNFGIEYWNSLDERYHTQALLETLNNINKEIEKINPFTNQQKFRNEISLFIVTDIENIKKHYHKLSLKYHPDKQKNNKNNAEIKFKIITKIYKDILLGS